MLTKEDECRVFAFFKRQRRQAIFVTRGASVRAAGTTTACGRNNESKIMDLASEKR
jgi:hypothetical protein